MDEKKKLTYKDVEEALKEYESADLFHHLPDAESADKNSVHLKWIESFKSKLGVKIIESMNSEEYIRFDTGGLHFIVLKAYLQKRTENNFKTDLDYKIRKGKEINIFTA